MKGNTAGRPTVTPDVTLRWVPYIRPWPGVEDGVFGVSRHAEFIFGTATGGIFATRLCHASVTLCHDPVTLGHACDDIPVII